MKKNMNMHAWGRTEKKKKKKIKKKNNRNKVRDKRRKHLEYCNLCME